MGCDVLGETLKRLDCAIRFARWRQGNDTLARDILARVLGRMPKAGEPSEKVTLIGKLLDLEANGEGRASPSRTRSSSAVDSSSI